MDLFFFFYLFSTLISVMALLSFSVSCYFIMFSFSRLFLSFHVCHLMSSFYSFPFLLSCFVIPFPCLVFIEVPRPPFFFSSGFIRMILSVFFQYFFLPVISCYFFSFPTLIHEYISLPFIFCHLS